MTLTVADIAAALGTEVLGDGSLTVARLAEPAEAGPDDLALAMSPKYGEALTQGRARAAVVWPGADWQAMGLSAAIPVGRPRLAMADLTREFDRGPGWPEGIHPTALIDPRADLAADVSVGPYAVIGPDVRIGPGGRIGAHVTIGAGSRLGAGALVHPGVRIGPRVTIGDRLIVHPNAVIGADGFSFVTAEVSLVENARRTLGDTGAAEAQDWRRIHSLGGVEIGDDVEIGACSAIDYGTIRATRIGSGTRIDNHVHIAHNVVVGRSTLMAAHVGIGGSSTIGDHCVFGGQVGIADNITVGDRVIAGGASKILSNVPAGRVVQGYPAVRMETHVESYKALRRLPRLIEELRGRQKAVPKPDQSD
jgi:UDP-3-O-[3-hydroxymyristoyl] glucosamine N-acyltransferase